MHSTYVARRFVRPPKTQSYSNSQFVKTVTSVYKPLRAFSFNVLHFLKVPCLFVSFVLTTLNIVLLL
jgi:hypothetical protein